MSLNNIAPYGDWIQINRHTPGTWHDLEERNPGATSGGEAGCEEEGESDLETVSSSMTTLA